MRTQFLACLCMLIALFMLGCAAWSQPDGWDPNKPINGEWTDAQGHHHIVYKDGTSIETYTITEKDGTVQTVTYYYDKENHLWCVERDYKYPDGSEVITSDGYQTIGTFTVQVSHSRTTIQPDGSYEKTVNEWSPDGTHTVYSEEKGKNGVPSDTFIVDGHYDHGKWHFLVTIIDWQGKEKIVNAVSGDSEDWSKDFLDGGWDSQTVTRWDDWFYYITYHYKWRGQWVTKTEDKSKFANAYDPAVIESAVPPNNSNITAPKPKKKSGKTSRNMNGLAYTGTAIHRFFLSADPRIASNVLATRVLRKSGQFLPALGSIRPDNTQPADQDPTVSDLEREEHQRDLDRRRSDGPLFSLTPGAPSGGSDPKLQQPVVPQLFNMPTNIGRFDSVPTFTAPTLPGGATGTAPFQPFQPPTGFSPTQTLAPPAAVPGNSAPVIVPGTGRPQIPVTTPVPNPR